MKPSNKISDETNVAAKNRMGQTFQMRKLVSFTHPSLHLSHSTIDSFTWNILIRAQSHLSSPAFPPISLFLRMRRHNVKPDSHTFPFLLQSFNSPTHFFSGQKIHAQVLHFGFFRDAFVGTSLINMYSSCGDLGFAHQVFDEMSERDLPAWNSVINAYIHAGLLDAAWKVFDVMPERNVISWSGMINGYVKWGKYKEALVLFREMQKMGVNHVRPNEFTMSGVLSACGRLGALEHGKWAHAYIDKSGMKVDVILGTALIDMYARCGSIERARSVFDQLGSNKDIKAWTAMISGLAMHGHGKEGLDLFSKMLNHGMNPNSVTFLSVLCACVHCGLVHDGDNYFRLMTEEFGILPLIQHYGCMVDLYGRAGLIDKAWNVVKSMPMEPDVLIWGALLSGSRVHGNTKTCEVALRKLIELEPSNSGAYVLLSNVYAKTGRWKDARHIRDLMEGNGIKKVPGCSLVEIGGTIHEFFAGDESHPETKEIYLMLEEMMNRLKMEGYVANTKVVLLDLDEEAKEISVSLHSEKLAVAFALLKTGAGTPIRVVKNLRICVDCHDAMKIISRVYGREIIVRDCSRFHHFRFGLCSCKSYW